MPEFFHKPVMLAEVLAALQASGWRRYADGTVGGGGHAAAMLAASSPTGGLYGCDRDGAAIGAASRRLANLRAGLKFGAAILRRWRTGFPPAVATECCWTWA